MGGGVFIAVANSERMVDLFFVWNSFQKKHKQEKNRPVIENQ